MSRIEEIITELEEYIENCKYQPLSNSKILVNRDEIDELLADLRNQTPDEIKKYQKIVSNKDAILNDAQQKANDILSSAQVQAAEMISEHEIMDQANAQANEVITIASNQAQEILDKAAEDADNIRTAAIEYTDNLLENLSNIISHTLGSSRERYESLNGSLQECLDIVNKNRSELVPQNDPAEDGFSIIAAEEEEEA